MNDIPFSDVYFNGMIRDLKGRKMSKSLGNSPDPLWLFEGADKEQVVEFAKANESAKEGIPAYGADAVRLTLLYSTPLGGDIRFDHLSCELGQKFTNKLWNVSRFVLMNLKKDESLITLEKLDRNKLDLADRWILGRLSKAIHVIQRALKAFKLNDATHALYSFVWTEYCDWYIELVKNRLYDDSDPDNQRIARSITVFVLDAILRLLHPIVPFITEEIWHALPGENRDGKSIMEQAYPDVQKSRQDKAVERDMIFIQQVIGSIRTIRGEMNVPPSKEADVYINTKDTQKIDLLFANQTAIRKLARVAKIEIEEARPPFAASAVVQGIDIYVPLADLIDVEMERNRLQKEINRLQGQLEGLNKKLANQKFISRAPQEVVDKEKQKKQDWETDLKKLLDHLKNLSSG